MRFALAAMLGLLVSVSAASAEENACDKAEMQSLLAHGSPDDIVSACTTLIQSGSLNNEDLARAYKFRAQVYENKGDDADALPDYNKVVSLNAGGDSDILYKRGRFHDEPGGFDRAVAYYTEAIKLRPDYQEAFVGRAMAYHHKGDEPHAIADLDEAIALIPADYLGYAFRCAVRADMGAQLDIALADCNKSLQIKDDDLAHMARGLVYLRTAKWDAANADYAAAIALAKRESDPPDPDALIGRALARLRKGEKAARPELAKLAKLYPTTYARFAAQGLLP